MPIIQIGLVDTTRKLSPDIVHAAAMALNLQVMRDLPQFWPVAATVMYLPNPDSLPVGTWPVQLVDELPAGEGGYHSDSNNQPFAKVVAPPGDPSWTIDASHEILEMLIDPYGSTMQTALAIEVVDGDVQDGTGHFEYLVEACDPCQGQDYAYLCNGFPVSDFITPHFYDAQTIPGTRHSFNGKLNGPRQVLPGGYLSFFDASTNRWKQLTYLNPDSDPEIVDIGTPDPSKMLREWIDGKVATGTAARSNDGDAYRESRDVAERSRTHIAELKRVARLRAALYT